MIVDATDNVIFWTILFGGMFIFVTAALMYHNLKEKIIFLHRKLHQLEISTYRHEMALEIEEILPLPWEIDGSERENLSTPSSTKDGNVIYLNKKD